MPSTQHSALSTQDVALIINGTVYSGWKEVSVRRSLDLFADSFDLTLTDNQVGQGRTIKLGSPCQVRIGTEKLITGWVDKIRPAYDAKSRKLTVSGRSKTADLVDCSLPPRETAGSQQNDRNLLELAQFVCKKLGIQATSTVSGLEKRSISTIETEQTLFEFLEKQARIDGVMLVTDPDGNLVITRASSAKVATALILGENIEAAEGEFSERDRFSHYYVDAQLAGSDDINGEASAHVTGIARDSNVRYKPTTILLNNESLAQAKRRAEWERNVQYGRSRQATYTVSGWRHADGLWRPNTNVLVRDAWMGFEDEWLMIGTVEFVYNAQGRRTRLTVMPAEAYDLIPLPAEDGGVW